LLPVKRTTYPMQQHVTATNKRPHRSDRSIDSDSGVDAGRIMIAAMRTRSRGWWLNRLAAVLVAIGVVAAGYFVYRSTIGYWHRLEHAASKIDTPPGMHRLFQTRVGSWFCVVTCEGRDATVDIVFTTRLSKDEACMAFRNEISQSLRIRGDEEDDESWWCPFTASIPAVKSDAKGGVAYVTADEFRDPIYEPEWFARVRPLRPGESLVFVDLNSGIE